MAPSLTKHDLGIDGHGHIRVDGLLFVDGRENVYRPFEDVIAELRQVRG